MDEERFACYELLFFIAKADGDISPNEIELLRHIAEENGLTAEQALEVKIDVLGGLMSIEEIASRIKSQELKYELISDLITLGYADGKYTSDERECVAKICEILHIDKSVQMKAEAVFLSGKAKSKLANGAMFVGNSAVKLGNIGLEGGKKLGKIVRHGLGSVSTKVSDAVATTKQLKKENRELREMIEKNNLSDSLKQKIILQLNEKIARLNSELEHEKSRNDQNEQTIELLQSQMDDLLMTLEAAMQTESA